MLPSFRLCCCAAPLLLGACQRATYHFQPAPATLATCTTQAVGSRLVDTAVVARPLPAFLATAGQRTAIRFVHRRRAAASVGQPAAKQSLRLAAPRLASPRASQSVTAAAGPQPVRQRSRVLAAVLAGLSLLYPFGTQYYYLGYTGRGLAVLGFEVFALVLFFLDHPLLSSSVAVGAPGVIALVVVAGLFLFQLYDLYRILKGTLKPKDGDYR